MGEVKELNIKNQTYYFFHDMIDIKNFHSNLLKIDKKLHEDIDIYYIGYITIKNFNDCEHIHSVNPLYLIIYSATGYFEEKMVKNTSFLLQRINMRKFFLELHQKLKYLMVEKKCFMRKITLKSELILTIIYL